MVPLEVTHTALASPAVLARMFHRGTSSAAPISAFKGLVELLLTFFETTYRCVWAGAEAGCERTAAGMRATAAQVC
jgi:hypothetical protein